jgi:hypothetical protein
VKSSSSDSGAWQPCPPGELVEIAGRLQGRRRRKDRARLLAASALVLLAVGAISLSLGLWQKNGDPRPDPVTGEFHFGGISCTELHRALPGLKARTLDDATLARVREHIEKCPHCNVFARLIQEPAQTGQVPVANPDGPAKGQSFVLR